LIDGLMAQRPEPEVKAVVPLTPARREALPLPGTQTNPGGTRSAPR
jgi:hypothetical protein